MRKRALAALLCLTLLGAALGGCQAGGEITPSSAPSPTATGGELTKQTAQGFYFDTFITMTAYWQDDTPLKEALAECTRYENLLSKTVEGSDVWNINHAEGKRVAVHEDTRDILEKALNYAELSGGAFDVTIGPCSALWDFTDNEAVLPDADALARAAELVDYTQVDVNDEGVQIPAGMSIDLGAIAKGYIADRIADFLEEQGVTSAILNFGGNVQTIGTKPSGDKWKVGIQDPKEPHGDSIAVIEVGSTAVVTSGIYERGFDLDGVRYHHLLDPATGWPIQNDLAGVTVLVADSFDGDALSTTLFALGSAEGLKMAEDMEGVEAIFITRDDQITVTSGLEGRLTMLK